MTRLINSLVCSILAPDIAPAKLPHNDKGAHLQRRTGAFNYHPARAFRKNGQTLRQLADGTVYVVTPKGQQKVSA